MANHTKTITLTETQQKILSNDLYNDSDICRNSVPY